MASAALPDELRRFILSNIASVPHLEALLLLHATPEQAWESLAVSQRLYVSEYVAQKLLDELCAAGMLSRTESVKSSKYCFQPSQPEFAELISRLAKAYRRDLVGITRLIHSQTDRQAQQFADAFIWRKDV